MDERIIKAVEAAFDAELSEKTIGECTPSNIESWDSLSFLNLVLALEEEFDISFEPEEISQMVEGGKAISEIISKKI